MTYSPQYETTDFYQKQLGHTECLLLVHVNAGNLITNLETQDNSGGCSKFYSGTASNLPSAAEAARGKAFGEKMAAIKSIFDRYQAVCVKPEYATLFVKSPCDGSQIQLVGAPASERKMPPEQKVMLAKWTAEMGAIVGDYVAFFRSTGEPGDQVVADQIDSKKAKIAAAINTPTFFYPERQTTLNAYNLTRYAKSHYQQYFN